MSKQTDPFSFQELPSAADHVNDAFSRLNLHKHDAPTFHAFLIAALTPQAPVTPQNAESFNIETGNRLSAIINTIALARARCRPHFDLPQDLPEPFMIVASMPSLPDNGYGHMRDLLSGCSYSHAIVEAHRCFYTLRRVDSELAKTGLERATIPPDLYKSLTRSEKLLLELRAAQIAREAVSAIQRDAGRETLAEAFAKVARIRTVMANTDSAMVKYFQTYDEAITNHIQANGNPGRPAPFGARLRAHLQEPGPSASDVKKGPDPVQNGGGSVLMVTFGGRAPKLS